MTIRSGVRWADPEAVEGAVRELADRLRRAHPVIREIRWFGSWVDGRAAAGSDVDLCLIVERDPRPRLPELSPGLHRAIEAGRIV